MTSNSILVIESLDKAFDLRHAAAALAKWFGKREAAIFNSSGASGGHPEFVPLARPTRMRKQRLGQPRRPLVRTGAMLRDFSAGVALEAYEDRVVLGPRPGESKDYAFWAARNNPRRDPTPPLTPAERSEVIDLIAAAVSRAVEGARGRR